VGAAEKHAEVVKILLERGANVNAATKSGFTPLLFAVVKNDVASVQLLLKAGADPNYTLPDKTRVLSVAATYKSVAAAIALIEGGADINFTDANGYKPLHLAAQTGPVELVKKLLAKGADLNAHTPKARGGDTDASGAFFRAPSGEQTPAASRSQSQPGRCDASIDRGRRQSEGQGAGWHYAAAFGGWQRSRPSGEIRLSVRQRSECGGRIRFTAMHESVSRTGQAATATQVTELVQYLADIGVPIDEVDVRGRTPIQLGDLSYIDMPIQRMADILISRGIRQSTSPRNTSSRRRPNPGTQGFSPAASRNREATSANFQSRGCRCIRRRLHGHCCGPATRAPEFCAAEN